MIKKILVGVLGILLIPVCVAFTISLYQQLVFVGDNPQNRIYFLLGVGVYLVVHLFFYVPGKLFDAEHKSLDAAVKWVTAGKVQKLNPQATVKEDQVHPNVILTLAPHFFPVYAVLFAFLYFAASLFWEVGSMIRPLLFLMGAGLVFHMVFTAQSLKTRHKKLIGSAYLLSITLIYIFNVAIVTFAMSLLFKVISMKDFLAASCGMTKDIYVDIFRQLF
ncbi:MAG: hypothetical protein ABIH01_05105 [Candidatus Omnitrophota bacterium]